MRTQSRNKLLDALPAADYRRLLPDLHRADLADGDELPLCGQRRVYFPTSGICSITSAMEDHRIIEISSVGREGVIGLPMFVVAPASATRIFRQMSSGSAQYMLLTVLEREMVRGGALRNLVDRYSQALLHALVRTAACCSLHSLQERCARWLLSMVDRLETRDVPCTRAALARVLGATRKDMAIVLRRLDELGALESQGGRLRVVHRKILERLTCQCYWTEKDELCQALPPRPSREATYDHAKILQMPSAAVCEICQSTRSLPHYSEHDCLREIDGEIREAFKRIRVLRNQRQELLEERLSTVWAVIAKWRGSA
jgi:CRP-like cAMP-binding protein